MLNKTAPVLAAAAVFGAASVAQANEPRDEWGDSSTVLRAAHGGTGFWPHWRGHRGAFFGFAYAPRALPALAS
jgi:hypothetical protein